MPDHVPHTLQDGDAESLLRELASWGPTTTIVLHGGCVFEFKGVFPSGHVAEGYYNLDGGMPGFHGPIRLAEIEAIGFQEKQHRGRDSYAFTFENGNGENLFKIFLGRTEAGEVYAGQLERFRTIRDQHLTN